MCDYWDDRQFIPPFSPGFQVVPDAAVPDEGFGFPPAGGLGTMPTPGIPGGGAGSGGMGMNVPSGPPPAMMPTKPQMPPGAVFAVDPGAISGCLYRFTAIYPRFGQPFWAWLVFVGPRSAAGYRWNGFSWNPFGIDLNLIDYFQCI